MASIEKLWSIFLICFEAVSVTRNTLLTPHFTVNQCDSVTSKKLPNVNKNCSKMIPLEKINILLTAYLKAR